MTQKVGFLGGKFLPVHLGHVYSITKASTLVDELYVVVSSSEKRDRFLCEEKGNIKYIPAEVRCAWLGELFADNPVVKVINVIDKYGHGDYNWEEGAEQFREAIGKQITHVFSGEKGYENIFGKLYPEAKHIVVSEKQEFSISSTQIRQGINFNKYWKYFPKPVRAYYTKKIAIVGTESCGKSVLTANLARLFNTEYVHEVGRDYCEQYSNQLTPEIFDRIALEQSLLQEERLREGNEYLFVDSDAVLTQYYLNMYLGKSSRLIDEIIRKEQYDLVFYLEPDVEWVEDGYRFAGGEEKRKKLNRELKEMYNSYGIDVIVISGSYTERFDKIMTYLKTTSFLQSAGDS